ncbi:HNH endonuclease [Candidatus Saccharibacteria bacterium]|nr:HNH endonuclease [Candidatus Saccharibacteria bacterium]
MRLRRVVVVIVSLVGFGVIILAATPPVAEQVNKKTQPISIHTEPSGSAAKLLETLVVKGRAPKTNYSRSQFGSGWSTTNGCDTRNIILHRDLQSPVLDEACSVISGTLNDPYTGLVITFSKGSSDIQIDHVVALSNSWQTGAQGLTRTQRIQLANDPLELLAVQGAANQQKSDGDAATWVPSNKSFRCEYVARQIAVKNKYGLWVTPAEKQAILQVLDSCPEQTLPSR